MKPSTAPFMINYRVADLDALLEQLRSEGVEIDEKSKEYEYGRFGWVTDPEGNRVEPWEPPKKVSENRAADERSCIRDSAIRHVR